MYWQKWSDKFRKELSLETHPVAVAFAGAQASEGASSQGKVSVCQALKRACEGEAVTVSAETCGCPGGLVNLGLGQTPAQGKERLVDFLVNKEKAYCSRTALYRSQQIVLPPAGLGRRVIFSPLSMAQVQPDIVAFIGKPGSLHQMVSFASYWEGGPIKPELTGPACRTGITYPVVTGEIGLSLLDFGARRLAGFAEDQLLIAVPFHKMAGIVEALDQRAGGQHEQARENIEREIDELGKVEPV